MDHVVMRAGTNAAKSARFGLSILDEKTSFRALIPTNSRSKEDVVEKVFQIEGPEPSQVGRRWWTDAAPEFAAASLTIRRLRPLAHFTSIPFRPQSNGVIERSNRLLTEGANTCIFAAGVDAKWWVCAVQHWCAMYNGFQIGADGKTPWQRRFNEDAPFRLYPFGSLVFVKPPTSSFCTNSSVRKSL